MVHLIFSCRYLSLSSIMNDLPLLIGLPTLVLVIFVKSTTSTANCAFDNSKWEWNSGLCLIYEPRRTFIWARADEYCKQHQGFLLWLNNRQEHIKVNKFLRKKKHYLFCTIGLHRAKTGQMKNKLIWSGNFTSDYRSNRIYWQHNDCFAIFHSVFNNDRFMVFAGLSPTFKNPFVCRRDVTRDHCNDCNNGQ